jgi:aminoglycoside/choline kinase family phosphotransferase
MDTPRTEVRRYLDRICPDATATMLAGDASSRRFYRIHLPAGGSHVLMDYGRPFAGETDDMVLGGVFRAAKLPVADLLDASPETGCLLLEDLGDHTLESLLVDDSGRATPEARALLERAVRLAANVAERGSPELARSPRSDGPALDSERFCFETDYFLQHWAGSLLGRGDPPSDLREHLHALAKLAAATPCPVFCHRDFHSRNLMVANDGQLAMVDIQDARWGPDSYDLASLLRDAYAEIDESWIEPLIKLYLEALSDSPDPGPFLQRFERVAAQRMIKALGTFGFQTAVRGNERYLHAARRTVARLQRALPGNEELRPLGELLIREGLLVEPT